MIKFLNSLFILNTKQKKRITKNIFSGLTTESIQIFIQIFFAPLMLFFWGMENFGIWIFLLSIPNIFLIFNINMADGVIQEITMCQSKGKIKKANQIFQNSIILVLFNTTIVTLLILFFYLFYQIDFSILDNIKTGELTIILSLLLSTIYIQLLQSIFITGINSQGKLYLGYNITTVVEIFSKVSIALSGFFFDSLLYPVIIYFSYSVIKFLLFIYFFKITNKYLFLSFKLVSAKIIKKIIRLSIGHTANLISPVIKHSGLIIILGIFYDPYIIGYVVTVKTLFYFFPVRFFSKLSHVTLYEQANFFMKEKINVVKKNLFSFCKFVFFLLTIFFIMSFIFGPWVYKIWLNNRYQLDTIFLLLILIDVSFYIMRDSLTSLLDSINKNLLVGLLEITLTLILIIIVYFSCSFGFSYLYPFTFMAISSLISLIIGFIMIKKFFYKKI